MSNDDSVPEQWKPLPQHPNYMVSNHGRVMSYMRKAPRLLSVQTTKDGYKQVGLTLNGVNRVVPVARLVAWAFLPKPTNGETYVARKNKDKGDNRPENLEWRGGNKL